MRKKHLIILMGFVMTFTLITPLTAVVSGIGLYPAEMRVTNAVGSGVIGSIVLVNSESEPKYIVLQVETPSKVSSELQHLRVICEGCHDTHQRYEIVNGSCPKCGSKSLTFYDIVPDEILNHISLRGKDCNLTKKGNAYVTDEKYPSNGQCTVEVLLDLPHAEKYANTHWEARVTATTTSDPNAVGVGVVAGVQMRLLLDVPSVESSSIPLGKISTAMFGTIAGGLIGFLCLVYMHKKRYAIKSTRNFQNRPEPVKAEIKYQKEPFTIHPSLLENIRNIGMTGSIKFDQKHPTIVRDIEGTVASSVNPPSDGKELSNIETEIDRLLKFRGK